MFKISTQLLKSKPGSCNRRDIGKVIDSISTTTSNEKINLKFNIDRWSPKSPCTYLHT